ncbi:hypothetical protein HY78_18735 [Rhizorhabdus wittichii DC-6]|nr:hypothetical protein HY78_18735 [Rhizorhabdus wittichii DC-6]
MSTDGTIAFEAQGKARSLRFTVNALCLLEDKLEKSTLDIATELQFNPRITTVRAMFWAGGGDHDMTLGQVGEMVDDLGIEKAIDIARRAFAAAFPDEDRSDRKGKARPRKAVAG